MAYLENRFNMRPEGVVSKKLMGDLKIAYAIRSWSLREACSAGNASQQTIKVQRAAAAYFAYLNRAEDPQDECLHNDQKSRTHSKAEVDANILANVGIAAILLVYFRPVFQPNTST